MIVTNYNLPEKQLLVTVDLRVHQDSDLAKVERVACDVAAEVMREVPGGVPDFVPSVRYRGIGASSIDFAVFLSGKEFVDQLLIKHEFIKRIHRRFEDRRNRDPLSDHGGKLRTGKESRRGGA